MVFDEVDAGIGAVAEWSAASCAARRRALVLCVTHLPGRRAGACAPQGDQVERCIVDTRTRIETLTSAPASTIARMLGGVDITAKRWRMPGRARRHAACGD